MKTIFMILKSFNFKRIYKKEYIFLLPVLVESEVQETKRC